MDQKNRAIAALAHYHAAMSWPRREQGLNRYALIGLATALTPVVALCLAAGLTGADPGALAGQDLPAPTATGASLDLAMHLSADAAASLNLIFAGPKAAPANPLPDPAFLGQCSRALLLILSVGTLALLIVGGVFWANLTLIRQHVSRLDRDRDRRANHALFGFSYDLMFLWGLLYAVVLFALSHGSGLAGAVMAPRPGHCLAETGPQTSAALFIFMLVMATGTLLNLHIAAAACWTIARNYPLRQQMQDLWDALAPVINNDPRAKISSRDMLLHLIDHHAELLPEDRPRLMLARLMTPSQLLEQLDAVIVPLAVALVAALAALASVVSLLTLPHGLPEDLQAAQDAAREAWFILLGAAMSLSLALAYVLPFIRLKVYASAATEVKSPDAEDAWTVGPVRWPNNPGLPYGQTEPVQITRPSPAPAAKFPDDMTDYLGADARKFQTMLAAVRHGGAAQELLSEKLSSQVMKLLALASPALAGGFFGLL